jgi:hypothetical protein
VRSQQFALRSDGDWETIKIVGARKSFCNSVKFR